MSLPKNALISTIRPSVTQDRQGTPVENFTIPPATAIDTSVPASIQQMSQSDVITFQKRGMSVDFEIFVFRRVGCMKGDRAVDGTGTIYTIQDVEDMAGRGKVFCIRAKKLRSSS